MNNRVFWYVLVIVSVSAIGVTATIYLLNALMHAPLLVWVFVWACLVATATGVSIRFLLMPVLHSGAALVDKFTDVAIKIDERRATRELQRAQVQTIDFSQQAIVSGGALYTLPAATIQLLQSQQRALPEPRTEETAVVESAAQLEVIRYADIMHEIPPMLSLLGIHPHNRALEIVQPGCYKTSWFVGGSNTGKTNTVYGKVQDMVRWGARLIICDPHANKGDGLSNKLKAFHHTLLKPPVQTDMQIKNAILAFLDEFKARRDSGKSCAQKWLIVIDEVNGLANHPVKISDDERDMLFEEYGIKIKENVVKMQVFLKILAETCGYESRGFEMFGFFISQKVAGLSWLRNAMMSVFVHGLLMESEAMLAANNNKEHAKLVMAFKTGQTLIYGYEIAKPLILQQPLYELKDESPSSYPGTSEVGTSNASEDEEYFDELVKQPEVDTEPALPQAQKTSADEQRITRVARLMADGNSVNEILRIEWEVNNPGAKYQRALGELREVQRVIAARSMQEV